MEDDYREDELQQQQENAEARESFNKMLIETKSAYEKIFGEKLNDLFVGYN
jgi:hypothetical protein